MHPSHNRRLRERRQGSPVRDEGVAGIAVTLEDSITSVKFPFTDVRVIASEGTYRDTARVTEITGSATSARTIGLLFERPGTYSVEVTAAGLCAVASGGYHRRQGHGRLRPRDYAIHRREVAAAVR